MSRRKELLVGLAVVGLAILAWWWSSPGEPPPATEPGAPAATAPPRAPRAADPPTPPAEPAPTPEAPGLGFFGRVVDDVGAPIAGAHVHLLDPADTRIASTRTDERGAFRLTPPEGPTPAAVSARAPRHGSARAPVGPPNVALVLTLPRRPVVEGIVVDPDDEPLADVRVALLASDPHRGSMNLLEHQRTSADGSFALTVANDASALRLRARHASHGRAELALGPDPGFVKIVLPRGGSLEGRVLDGRGAPIAAFTIQVDTSVGPGPSATFSDPDGRFSIGPVAAGTARLVAVAPEHRPGTLEAAVAAGEATRGLTLVLGDSPTLSGRVFDADTREGLGGARVRLIEDRAARSVETETDALGRYALSSLPEGHFSIDVRREGYRTVVTGGLSGQSAGVRDVGLERDTGGGGPQLTGLGVVLRVTSEGVQIDRVLDDSSALNVLREGDVLLEVDGVPVAELGLGEIAHRIRGEPGSEVQVLVYRPGTDAPMPVALRRKRIDMPGHR